MKKRKKRLQTPATNRRLLPEAENHDACIGGLGGFGIFRGFRSGTNYQNFAKAFRVDYPLMACVKPNAARLKGAKDFKPRELASGEIGGTLLGELLMAIQELLND